MCVCVRSLVLSFSDNYARAKISFPRKLALHYKFGVESNLRVRLSRAVTDARIKAQRI